MGDRRKRHKNARHNSAMGEFAELAYQGRSSIPVNARLYRLIASE